MKVPILLTTFNRLDTTLRVIERIREYAPNKIYISSDFGRPTRKMQEKNMIEIEWVHFIRKSILKQIDWECKIEILFFSSNQGCGKAISSAITWFFSQEECGIILEDDCLPNQSFFTFCEECLAKYKDNEQIFMISGWSAMDFMPKEKAKLKEDYFFSKYNHIWGWASWRRAWKYYNKEIEEFEKNFANLLFDTRKEKKYWYQIFKLYSQGKIDTWDYPWTFTMWKHQALSIYPKYNMIENIGLNHKDATHTNTESPFENMKTYHIKTPIQHPSSIQRNKILDKKNCLITCTPSIFSRFLRKIKFMYQTLFKKAR